MQVTGTLISYYFYCTRRLWLHANGIRFEDTSDDVTMGVLIEENSYKQRSSKYEQVAMEGVKVDFYSSKEKIIHEVKKSSKFHETHIWQLKYYIYVFEQNGIDGVSGVLEYPKERKTEEVYLSEPDRVFIEEMVLKVKAIIDSDHCPDPIKKPKCKNCAYYDFCYVAELL